MGFPFPSPAIFSIAILFFVISSYSSLASSVTKKHFMYKGSSLLVEDYLSDLLTSPDETFTCGFYRFGTNNRFSFSIWFTNSEEGSSQGTVVWTANRQHPVNGRGSRVSLQRDGTMVLTDVDGSIVWFINTNTTGTGVDKAELLNTGNLVLKDPFGKILWQSFDSPTDTLLPSQPLTRHTKLVSAMAIGTHASGYFTFNFDSDSVLRLMYDGPEVSSLYWPDPDFTIFENGRTNYNSSRIALLDDMGAFLSSDRTNFFASDLGSGIKRRLTLDYDGNLRLYSLDESTKSWTVTWEALPRPCDIHGLCGRNGVCTYTPKPKCSCPPGYEIVDPSDWSKGCRPKFNWTCDQTQQYTFVEVPHTDFWGYDLDYRPSSSLEHCMKLCLENCSCEVFVYRLMKGTQNCYMKFALFNGRSASDFPGSAYLKLPRSLNLTSAKTAASTTLVTSDYTCRPEEVDPVEVGSSQTYNANNRRTRWVYLYMFVFAIGIIEILFLASGWWCLYRRGDGVSKSTANGYHTLSSEFRMFTYSELKKATGMFKEELGRGGSGAVYKGVLQDDRVVAVKKLGDVLQGEEELRAEVITFGRVNHMNLVKMWGFCSEGTHRLLVYEYIENGSLNNYLFSNASNNSNNGAILLNWRERFRIALGTAKGLAYLHHECLEWVIHCDVKPENILLDGNFEPKIADFGLAKLSKRGGSGCQFTRIRGTKGYMAPEWFLNLPITAKVDVYSYGVVILEIVKGSRLSDWVVVDGEEEAELIRFLWVARKKIAECKDDSWVEDMVDPALKGQFNQQQAAIMIEIGISCVEEDRSRRPTMDAVVQTLLDCEDDPKLVL
ncbi:PREDICTED: putative receptor protein kinase ZmPK1 [Nelumbo nucifera]|uniref:Receptor-like serine/threonine-protein kinase n=1 Tax=Nelumbo nucifera TaxID=4432 RepID=A0A1U8A603_NELNU|nr:PREDICTED: putative receptor protein kinase ZmPK1 [Nelumbo nucifera]